MIGKGRIPLFKESCGLNVIGFTSFIVTCTHSKSNTQSYLTPMLNDDVDVIAISVPKKCLQ